MRRGARWVSLLVLPAAVGAGGLMYRPIRAQVSIIAPRGAKQPEGTAREDYPLFMKLQALLRARPPVKIDGDDELRALVLARYEAAVRLVQLYRVPYESGRITIARILSELPQLRDASLALSDDPADHIPMLEFCLEAARHREDVERKKYEALRTPTPGLEQAIYDRLDAQIRLRRAEKAAAARKK